MAEERFNTKETMEMYDIRPLKGLGQNFLHDMSVVERIVESADISEDDVVLEVGPGLGVMTGLMAKRAYKVFAVETDRRLEAPLNILKIQNPNIELIFNDIMKVDIKKEIIDKCEGRKVRVVANLPYYITTPVVMLFLEHSEGIESMTLMVQKEVGERMTAEPGGKEFGALSVSVKYYSEAVINFTVPPHCFTPRPSVDSCVVTMRLRKEPLFITENSDFFFKTVKAAFGQRRKMLTNALSNAAYMNVSSEDVKKVLDSMKIPQTVRGEVLTCEQFGELSNLLWNLKK